jgi:hypothetical protein
MTDKPVQAAAGRRKWLVLSGSILVCLFWISALWFNMYRYTLTGVLVEICWFPSIVLTVVLLATSFINWVKQKFRPASVYLFCILLIAVTFLAIAFL